MFLLDGTNQTKLLFNQNSDDSITIELPALTESQMPCDYAWTVAVSLFIHSYIKFNIYR